MSAARVSAIVPVRDGELYIEEAIDSILGQTRPPDQVIVVDDGSRDGTSARIEGYGDSVALIRREPGGVGAAVNTGLDAANGDLISFLDADDLWTPRKLEVQCEALAADPGIDTVFGHVEQFVSPDLTDTDRARLRPTPAAQPGKLKGTMLIRRAAVDRAGRFPTEWKVADFIGWYARAQEQGLSERMLGEVVLRRRLHRSNLGRSETDVRTEYASAIGALLRRRRGS
jgi:glycosyltransferase involved in cell wall biosynthesis